VFGGAIVPDSQEWLSYRQASRQADLTPEDSKDMFRERTALRSEIPPEDELEWPGGGSIGKINAT
jgi:hypothetical protein